MKKLINSFLIVSTIALSPAVQAQEHAPIEPAHSPVEEVLLQAPLNQSTEDVPPSIQDDSAITPSQEAQPPDQDSTTPLAPPDAAPSNESTTPEAMTSDTEEDEGTPVGQAASEGSKTAKRKQWQNIALAAVAVAVVVTALILIANNDGHRKDD